jgi:hypothetical protein
MKSALAEKQGHFFALDKKGHFFLSKHENCTK